MKKEEFIQQTEKKKGRMLRSAFFILSLLICLLIVRLYVVESLHISTDAMETSLHKGDLVLVNKLPCTPQRRSILLFTSPLRRDSLSSPWFISRCVGIPGDTIQVNSNGYLVNGKEYPNPPHTLDTYIVPPSGKKSLLELIQTHHIPLRDMKTDTTGLSLTLTSFEAYQLREELPDTLQSLLQIRPVPSYRFVIPQKDRAYRLDSLSLLACREAILDETNGKAVIRDGKLYIEGKLTHFFFFRQNYYWFLSDNRTDAIDSRHIGVVPEDHLIGKLFFCWFSRDKNKRFKRL